MMRQYELVERVKRYNPSTDEALLNRAYVYAMMAHGNQKRASGDLFFKSAGGGWASGGYRLVMSHPDAKAELPIELD